MKRINVLRWAMVPATLAAVCASLRAQAAPATQPTSQASATVTPASLPSMAPSGETSAANAACIRFQFDGIPYNEVVQRFVQATGKPLLGDLAIDGSLTFFDSQPYTYAEAFDTLNVILSMRGFALLENGHYMQLVPLAQMPQMPLRILKGGEISAEARPGEIVTVVLPLKFLDADTAAKTLVRMVSSFGSISPLSKGNGIILTDRMSNIQRLRQLLEIMDRSSLVEQQLKSYALKRASASSVAGIVNTLFGNAGAALRANRGEGGGDQPRPAPATSKDAVIATFDSRTNTLLVVGSAEKLSMVEEVIQRLDAEEIASGEMRIFDLKNARADEVVSIIKQTLPPQGGSSPRQGGGPPMPSPASGAQAVRVAADASANRVVVCGSPDQIATIEAMIAKLDQAVDSGGVRIVRLKATDAQQLTETILNAFVRRGGRGGGRNDAAMTVTADAKSNSLILAGSAADIRNAMALVEELDKEGVKSAREIRVVQVKGSDARMLADSLSRLFRQEMSGRGRGGGSSSS